MCVLSRRGHRTITEQPGSSFRKVRQLRKESDRILRNVRDLDDLFTTETLDTLTR